MIDQLIPSIIGFSLRSEDENTPMPRSAIEELVRVMKKEMYQQKQLFNAV